MVVRILGVRKSESKGRPAFNYAACKEYTAYEKDNSECEGMDVVSEFSYTDFGIRPGDVVDFEYEPGYQGRATLVGVRPISLAGNPFESEKEPEQKPEKEPDKKDDKDKKETK